MTIYRITAMHPSGKIKSFKIEAEDIPSARATFTEKYPKMGIITTDYLSGPSTNCHPMSNLKKRGHFKARLCQIRANLQSMTDDESGLLTEEEILQIQRITCKLDRVVALFPGRTMDLKKEGVI